MCVCAIAYFLLLENVQKCANFQIALFLHTKKRVIAHFQNVHLPNPEYFFSFKFSVLILKLNISMKLQASSLKYKIRAPSSKLLKLQASSKTPNFQVTGSKPRAKPIKLFNFFWLYSRVL